MNCAVWGDMRIIYAAFCVGLDAEPVEVCWAGELKRNDEL